MKDKRTNDTIIEFYKNLAEETKFEELPQYLQNCVQKYNIKYNTAQGIGQMIYMGNMGLFINYFADIQFIIVKRNIETQTGKSISDDELYKLILNTTPTLTDKISNYSINNLTMEDLNMIYRDFNIILKLYKKNKFFSIDYGKLNAVINHIHRRNLKVFANKKSCIDNIKAKKNLNDLGLQEYINVLIKDTLDEVAKEEQDNNNIFGFSQSYNR